MLLHLIMHALDMTLQMLHTPERLGAFLAGEFTTSGFAAGGRRTGASGGDGSGSSGATGSLGWSWCLFLFFFLL
jgi:hypothetical protein